MNSFEFRESEPRLIKVIGARLEIISIQDNVIFIKSVILKYMYMYVCIIGSSAD